MGKSSKLFNVASLVITFTMMGKLLAFVRDALLASRLGTGPESDAYFYANNMTTITFLSVAAAILTALIPSFVEVRESKGKEALFKFANNVLNLSFLLSAIIVIGVNLITFIVRVQTQDAKVFLTSGLISVLILSILLITITYVLIAVLQSMNNFIPAAMVTYPFNIGLILYIYFFADTSRLYALALATALAWGLQALVLLPALKKSGYKYQFVINIKEPRLHLILKMIIPIIIITMVHQTNVNIDNTYALYLGEGFGSGLYFGNIIYVSIVTVLIYGIMTVAYPKLSESKLKGNQQVNMYINDIVSILAFLLIPLTVGFMVLGEDIITFIYARGEFNQESVRLTTTVLRGYAIGAFAFGILEVLSKTYFASKRFLPPLIAIGMINLMNLLGNQIFGHWGLNAIALSTSISMILGAFGLLYYYAKKNNLQLSHMDMRNYWKIIVSSFVMFIAIICFHRFLQIYLTRVSTIYYMIRIVFTTLIGLIAYIMMNKLLKEKNTINILGEIGKRG